MRHIFQEFIDRLFDSVDAIDLRDGMASAASVLIATLRLTSNPRRVPHTSVAKQGQGGDSVKAASKPKRGVAAVERALAILGAFDETRTTLSLRDLANHTGLYKSTILRLCHSLETFGYIVRGPDAAYSLGPETLRLARVYKESAQQSDLIRRSLVDLAASSGESACFYIREGDERLCVYRVPARSPVRDTLREGDHLPLRQGAGGHVLLAFGGEKGPHYDEIRRTFVAWSRGERTPETAAVASPVFGVDDELIGTISLTGPVHRFNDSAIAAFVDMTRAAARELTRCLGSDARRFPSSHKA